MQQKKVRAKNSSSFHLLRKQMMGIQLIWCRWAGEGVGLQMVIRFLARDHQNWLLEASKSCCELCPIGLGASLGLPKGPLPQAQATQKNWIGARLVL